MTPTLRFGRSQDDLEKSAARLSDALGVTLELRDSDYWGGDYFLARRVDGLAEELRLHRNWDPYDGAPIFPEVSDARLLLHAHNTADEARLTAAALSAGFEALPGGS